MIWVERHLGDELSGWHALACAHQTTAQFHNSMCQLHNINLSSLAGDQKMSQKSEVVLLHVTNNVIITNKRR